MVLHTDVDVIDLALGNFKGKCHVCVGQVRDLLAPLVTDNDVNIEVAGYAALSLGLVFCGSAEEQCVGVALQVG